jgi:heavy metal translocating P-type ATPase
VKAIDLHEAASASPPTAETDQPALRRTLLTRLVGTVRRFPWVVATLLCAAAGGALTAAGAEVVGTGVVVGYVCLMAARSAWTMLRDVAHGRFGVDIIAVTAIVAATAVGEVWAALVIVLMLTTGEALEEFAANRAQRDLTALLARKPQTARRITSGGATEEVAIDAITAGDRILVRPREQVPVDAILISPEGIFDQSSLTGESLPDDKSAGDEILSGSVNGATAVTIRATREAKDSQYQQIVALVERAAQSKAPIVRLADRFALPFAVAAYVIAGAAWWLSGDPARFAEVLVVATPCPLIIAAPVAFMAGMSSAARDGIIIRSSATLEKLHRTRAFAFDKTGTLTQGAPALVAVRPEAPFTAEELLGVCASVEANSAHVLALATMKGAADRGLTLTGAEDAVETTASGVAAHVSGRAVAVGKRDFVAASIGVDVPPTPLRSGEMAIYAAVSGRFAGALIFEDRVRANAAATLRRLMSSGVREITMLTGDDRATAEHIAAALGITDVHANCLPADKVAAIANSRVRPIVMVGDGVNDAPVLAAADVGIAMGARGATAASEAADVVILRDDLGRVADAMDIGRRTVDIGLQSIWIGIGLSLALMLAAAFGFVPALLGAWLQEGIDVLAILWALRAIRS